MGSLKLGVGAGGGGRWLGLTFALGRGQCLHSLSLLNDFFVLGILLLENRYTQVDFFFLQYINFNYMLLCQFENLNGVDHYYFNFFLVTVDHDSGICGQTVSCRWINYGIKSGAQYHRVGHS